MESNQAIDAFSALAQPTRLDVFRLLLSAEPAGLASGDIARRMDVPHNTMSAHLAILQRAGLVTTRRDGRSIVYRAELEAVRRLVMFLLQDCCDGQPGLCTPVLETLLAQHAARRGCCP